MSKIKLLSALVIIAFVLCLSACGESKDIKADPTQSGSEQTASQAAEETAASDISSDNKAEGGDSGLNRAEAETADQDNSVSDNGQQSGGGNTSSGNTAQSGDNANSAADPADPDAAVSDSPREVDNAEVDFSDL